MFLDKSDLILTNFIFRRYEEKLVEFCKEILDFFGMFFNEQYFLLAFLKHNERYRCRLANAYLVRKCRSTYEGWTAGVHQPTNACFVNPDHGFIKAGSFWIEKLR